MSEAKAVAQQLGEIQADDGWVQVEIARLKSKSIVPLERVKTFHDWLDGKRKSRQSCRVVGESRTGKTVANEAYMYRHKPQQEAGRPPIVPVIYIQLPPKCGSRELFKEIIEYLKYRVANGTVSEFRGRAIDVLRGCRVEMLIIDEADRLKPDTNLR
jgi:hypothetical protein